MPSQQDSAPPRGSTTRLHGLETYVTEPADHRPIEGVVVIVSDAFGWEATHTRQLADHYADKGGYRVLVPDFLDGVVLPERTVDSLRGYISDNSSFIHKTICAFWVALAWIPFFLFHNLLRRRQVDSVVATYLSAVRSGPEASRGLPIFAAGFSWGARAALALASRDRPLVDAVFVAHPSNLKLPDDVQGIVAPVSLALAARDHSLGAEDVAKIGDAVKAKAGEVKVYVAGNGFSVRSDLSSVDNGRLADAAEDQAVAWFKSHSS